MEDKNGNKDQGSDYITVTNMADVDQTLSAITLSAGDLVHVKRQIAGVDPKQDTTIGAPLNIKTQND